MNIPEPKYGLYVYKFGTILEKHYHNEDPTEEAYWSYKMIRAGRIYPFWYSESEIERLDNVGQIGREGATQEPQECFGEEEKEG